MFWQYLSITLDRAAASGVVFGEKPCGGFPAPCVRLCWMSLQYLRISLAITNAQILQTHPATALDTLERAAASGVGVL